MKSSLLKSGFSKSNTTLSPRNASFENIPDMMDLYAQSQVEKYGKFMVPHKTILKKAQTVTVKLYDEFNDNQYAQMQRAVRSRMATRREYAAAAEPLPRITRKSSKAPETFKAPRRWCYVADAVGGIKEIEVTEDLRIPEMLIGLTDNKLQVEEMTAKCEKYDMQFDNVQRDADELQWVVEKALHDAIYDIRMGYYGVKFK